MSESKEARPLTTRERAVLDAMLGADFDGAAALRAQAMDITVVGTCGCGCPSIDFARHPGTGMRVRVNAGIHGTSDGMFLYTIDIPGRGETLGGIEYVGVGDKDRHELPTPDLLEVDPA